MSSNSNFRVGSNTQFTSELINFLKPKNDLTNQLPNGTNYGDYLYWNGSTFAVGDADVSIGAHAGQYSQGDVAIAIGSGAGNQSQGPACIAIGPSAGQTNQGYYSGSGPTGGFGCCSVAIGAQSGNDNQGFYSVALGPGAGYKNQTPGSIAIGYQAGYSNQGGTGSYGESMACCAIAIGVNAGQTAQGILSTAIGNAAGCVNQGDLAIAIGNYTGQSNQGTSAIAIGNNAGQYSQGEFSIAIGNYAGLNNQANHSIAINATSSTMDNNVTGTCKIAPLRDANPAPCQNTSFVESYGVSYTPSTAEVTYNSNPQIQRAFGQGSDLLLSDYNTSHFYYWNNPNTRLQYLDIGTSMVENAIYEVSFNLAGANASNNDMVLYPNYTAYSYIYTNYMNRNGMTGALQPTYSQGNGFQFDLVAGSLGVDPVGKITIFNFRNAKKIRTDVGDSYAITTGDGYWLAGVTSPSTYPLVYETDIQWSTVGRLQFGTLSFASAYVIVRRVG
jgi:hypothetical protein